MNYYPLFRVRSWNNGVRRMPFVFFFISISNELDITIHVIASQFFGHCDAISIRLWRHQQNENRASETRGRCEKVVVLSSFMYSLCHVRNEIMHVLSWRTVFELTHKITFSCALKHFGTWVHIIFSILTHLVTKCVQSCLNVRKLFSKMILKYAGFRVFYSVMIYILWHKLGLSIFWFQIEPKFLSCPLALSTKVPLAVLLMKSPCEAATHFLRVTNHFHETNNNGVYVNLTIWVALLVHNIDDVGQLIESIKINNLFGGQKFVFYKASYGTNLRRHLTHMSSRGWLIL